ncbi:MAG: hypothetical protein QX196_03145 [Methylococcaceae bacterium]
MAIQDFVTGQVLTSTQMDNLQTNDYNQTVSAKVASYVLVAADKGTRVTMSNAGATTITVNTSLFTAGDTLFITNIGVGASTITAGTATVSTASSLVLAQYDSGRLYFTSTGVAIWEKYQGAAASALTFLTGASFSAVASVSLPNSTFTSTYLNYKILFNITAAAGLIAETRFRMRASGTDDTAANYYMGGLYTTYAGGTGAVNTNGGTYVPYGAISAGSGGISSQSTQFEMTVFSPQTSNQTMFNTVGGKGSWTHQTLTGFYNAATVFDALTFYADAGTITGTYKVYGIANS